MIILWQYVHLVICDKYSGSEACVSASKMGNAYMQCTFESISNSVACFEIRKLAC